MFGFIAGFEFLEVLIIAGVITISSSAIVAKVLVDLKRTANPETELILGIIMFEDIFLAVYLSVVSGLVLGDSTSVGSALLSILIAFGYMILFFIVARKLPKLLNRLFNIRSNEVFIIVILRCCSLSPAFRKRFTLPKQSAPCFSDSCFPRQNMQARSSIWLYRFAISSVQCFSSASD